MAGRRVGHRRTTSTNPRAETAPATRPGRAGGAGWWEGAPYEGMGDDEAVNRYGQVAGEVDPDTYLKFARDARLDRGSAAGVWPMAM